MNKDQAFIIFILVCVVIFCVSLAKQKGAFLLRIVLRMVVGTAAIYLLNAAFELLKIELILGINLYSVCTIAALGFPGLVLLYGILGTRLL